VRKIFKILINFANPRLRARAEIPLMQLLITFLYLTIEYLFQSIGSADPWRRKTFYGQQRPNANGSWSPQALLGAKSANCLRVFV
jgi:hypothetical protein